MKKLGDSLFIGPVGLIALLIWLIGMNPPVITWIHSFQAAPNPLLILGWPVGLFFAIVWCIAFMVVWVLTMRKYGIEMCDLIEESDDIFCSAFEKASSKKPTVTS